MNNLNTFVQRFGRDGHLHFSDLWCLGDTEFERFEFMMQQQDHITNGGACDDGWEEMLSPEKTERLKGYRAKYDFITQQHPPHSLDYCFDLDHNPFARPKSSWEIRGEPQQCMTFISHGTLWHDSHKRPLLAAEWLLGQGIWPSHAMAEAAHDRVPVDIWSRVMQGHITTSQVRSMAGNTWNVPTFGAWIMFVLASCENKGRHEKLKRSLTLKTTDDTDVDDDFLDPDCTKKRKRQSCLPSISYD